MHQTLAASALRVYLTYVLHEAEEIRSEFTSRYRFSGTSSDKLHLQNVLETSERVVKCTLQCMNDTASAGLGWYGLAVVEAARDALAASVSSAQMYRSPVLCQHFQSLVQEHTIRSKCFVNAIVSGSRQDSELAALWVEATQYVLRCSQLRRAERQAKVPSLRHVDEARILETSTAKNTFQTTPEILELTVQAARCCRFAAVYMILDTHTSYHYAATLYKDAIQYFEKTTRCSTRVASMWCQAGSLMWQAADAVQAGALIDQMERHPMVREPYTRALEVARDAECAAGYITQVQKITSEVSSTTVSLANCKDTRQAAMWRAVLTEQEKTKSLREAHLEKFLEGASRSAETLKLLACIEPATARLQIVQRAQADLDTSVFRAEFCKSKARHCDHISDPHMREMWRFCWIRAAELLEQAVQQLLQTVQSCQYSALPESDRYKYQLAGLHARMYEFCASDLISTAVKYCNSARAAKAAEVLGRGPREAKWWLRATERQVHVADSYMKQIDSFAEVQRSNNTDIPSVPTAEAEHLREIGILATAADYLGRSFQFRVQPLVGCADQYTLAAELLMVKLSCDAVWHATVDRAVRFCLLLIDGVTLTNTGVTMAKLQVYERGCEYARCFLAVVTTCNTLAGIWQKAMAALVNGLHVLSTTPDQGMQIAMACAALHARSAEAFSECDIFYSILYGDLAELLSAAVHHELQFSPSTRLYRIELTKRVCALCTKSLSLPTELFKLHSTVHNDALQSLLCAHADAVAMATECRFQIAMVECESVEETTWQAALRAGVSLCETYFWQVKYLCVNESHVSDLEDQSVRCELLTVSLQCHMAAAQTMSPVWVVALAMCDEAEETEIGFAEATKAIQYFFSAGEALRSDDTELASLWMAVANAARELFLAVEDCEVSHRDEKKLRKQLFAEKTRVQALLAQRGRRVELAVVLAEIAERTSKTATVVTSCEEYISAEIEQWENEQALRYLGARAEALKASPVTAAASDTVETANFCKNEKNIENSHDDANQALDSASTPTTTPAIVGTRVKMARTRQRIAERLRKSLDRAARFEVMYAAPDLDNGCTAEDYCDTF